MPGAAVMGSYGPGKEAVMVLPVGQLCRQQRFTNAHRAWLIQARNRGQCCIAECRDRHGGHVLAAPALDALPGRFDQTGAGR